MMRIVMEYFSSFAIGIIVIILGNAFWTAVGVVFTIWVVYAVVREIMQEALVDEDE